MMFIMAPLDYHIMIKWTQYFESIACVLSIMLGHAYLGKTDELTFRYFRSFFGISFINIYISLVNIVIK